MKISEPLSLEAATWLPEERERVSDLLAAGRLTEAETEQLGLTEVPVSDIPGPQLAVRAAERVLAATRFDPARIGLVAHAWLYHQGHDFWSPPHYVADRLGAHDALPIGVRQMSNGGVAALGVAVDRLLADPTVEAALVTTGDRFVPPGFNRWRADYGAVYGDAGTAALLRRHDPDGQEPEGQAAERSGPTLLLRSLTFATAAEYEAMYRGRDPFTEVPLQAGIPVDVRRPKKAYLEEHGGMGPFLKSAAEAVRSTLLQSLAESGVEPGDPRIRCVALPRLGEHVLSITHALLDEILGVEILQLREGSGHLGAGDLLANLAHISASHGLAPGEFAVVIGGGGGFTWSCAVVEAA
ncbi:ketoacyl-ACP synthase III family protein [Streptomyces sp. NPDC060028]|uniref:ketoacyl-ACP synthase III family protein n=1 Tax=Streptomyces sp. NPDC060028 TaxID=3347041 RepID=UPI0036A486C3